MLCTILVSDSLLGKDFFRWTVFANKVNIFAKILFRNGSDIRKNMTVGKIVKNALSNWQGYFNMQ